MYKREMKTTLQAIRAERRTEEKDTKDLSIAVKTWPTEEGSQDIDE